MKILHTADWHLGKKLESFSRLEEQELVLDEICRIASEEKVDAVLVAGDVFDTFNPSTEASELFYRTLKRLGNNAQVPVVVIAGNHDSADRIEAPESLARENAVFLAGYPDVTLKPVKLASGVEILRSDSGFIELSLPNCQQPLRIILSPYANEVRLRSVFHTEDSQSELKKILSNRWNDICQNYCDTKGVNILLSHHFFIKDGEKAVESLDDERPILHVGGSQALEVSLIPKEVDYVALGHLHSFMDVNKSNESNEPKSAYFPVVYSGSPLAYHFGDKNNNKGVVIINNSENKLTFRKVELKNGKPLVRKRFEDIDKAVEWLKKNQDCWVELTVVCKEYLNSEDKRALYQAHNGIVSIIPETEGESRSEKLDINLSENIESLFKQYFEKKKGMEPNQVLLDLFREVLSEETNL